MLFLVHKFKYHFKDSPALIGIETIFDKIHTLEDAYRPFREYYLEWREERLEHVEFTVKVEDNEEFIVRRLYREKRVGTVEKLDEHTYRFSADIYDSSEMIPWIRTFICRIVQMNFSNRTQENKFKEDLDEMYRMYGVGEEVSK